jgi:2-polyprenyl-6-methoxyphenol hydroxylase-like FAD-dependent oxidoreductase
VERFDPVARRDGRQAFPDRTQHDHGRPRIPEIRLLSDFARCHGARRGGDQLDRRRKFKPDHQWRREDWNRRGDTRDFLPAFETWRFDWLDLPDLIRGAEGCYEYPMVDRDPLERWTLGPVTLLGDAAHPMYPIGSNGASQAVLDARVLAREIRAHGATQAALLAYEAERRPATAAIVLANRRNGPEQVMQAVEERAPDAFIRIEDVLSADELQEVAAGYKRIAGFDKDVLNNRAPIVAV